MTTKLFDGSRLSLKAEDPRPAAIAGGQASDWVKKDILRRMREKAEAAPVSEPIAFAASDVATAYAITVDLASQIIGSLERSLAIVARVDGQLGTPAGYVLGKG